MALEEIIRETADEAIKTANWVTKGQVFPGLFTNEETIRIKQEHREAVIALAQPLMFLLLDPRVIKLLALEYFSAPYPNMGIPNIDTGGKTTSTNRVTIASDGIFYPPSQGNYTRDKHLADGSFRWFFPLNQPSPQTIFDIRAFGTYDNQSRLSLHEEDADEFREKVNTTFPGEREWNFSVSESSKGGGRDFWIHKSYIANRVLEPVDLTAGQRFLHLFFLGTKGLFEVANQRIARMTLTKAEVERLRVLTSACDQATGIVLNAFPERK